VEVSCTFDDAEEALGGRAVTLINFIFFLGIIVGTLSIAQTTSWIQIVKTILLLSFVLLLGLVVLSHWRWHLQNGLQAVAFAIILAVVTGLLLTTTDAIFHDVLFHLFRVSLVDEKRKLRTARVTAATVGVLSVLLSLAIPCGFLGALLGAFCARQTPANIERFEEMRPREIPVARGR